MKNLKFFLAATLVVGQTTVGFAGNESGLPGEFLNFGVGARPMGMGRAFTAVADDIDALYWNPAGLATYRSSQLAFEHNPLEEDGAHQYVAYSQPLYALGNFGIGVINMTSGDVDRTDTNNSVIGTFESRETAYLASYANKWREKWAFGGTFKMAENSIDSKTERGFGADAGTIYKHNDRVRFGVMLRNALRPSYSFATEKETFPAILRAGTAVKFFNEHLTTALDLEKTVGLSQNPRWHLGVEGFIIDNIYLRAGVDQTEITTGLGIQWRNIRFDYSNGFQDLGFQNRFSLKLLFGGYEVDVKAKPNVFSPVGLNNKLLFNVHVAHQNRIVKWILSIRNSKNNEVVKSFQGFDAPPSTFEWDGMDAQGKRVEEGQYTYQMIVTDVKNQVEKTPIRTIRVKAPTPFEIEAK